MYITPVRFTFRTSRFGGGGFSASSPVGFSNSSLVSPMPRLNINLDAGFVGIFLSGTYRHLQQQHQFLHVHSASPPL